MRHDQGKRWTDVTREELEWMSQHASAFSEEALVFFFPAWLAADAPDPDHAWQVELVSTCLLPSAPECFTLEQRRVPHDALAFVYVPEGDPTDWNSPNLLFLKLAPSYKEVGQEI